MAASSMANVFTDVQSRFLEDHPCITGITYSYGSSATLAAQIVNGSPADVFISASEATMNTVKNAGKTLSVDNFAKNVGEIMVNPNSKYLGGITDIASLTDAVNAGVKVGLCVATAPCGSLANTILKNANTTRVAVADTESPSVEDLVTKIQMGELDAGIVYRSDCQYAEPRGLAKCVAIPDAVNATTGYYVAALTSRPIVQQYVNYINGSSFKTTLQVKFGFLAP
jgi:molybdate transport system substrate-binding protein